MSLIDDDKINLDNESEDDCLFDSEEQSKKVKFTYNGVPFTSLVEFLSIQGLDSMPLSDDMYVSMREYARRYIVEHCVDEQEGRSYILDLWKQDASGKKLIAEPVQEIEEPQACPSYPDKDIEQKFHDLLGRETAEELDRSTDSETVFGYTSEEFDKLYEENNGFNVTCPDAGPVSDEDFGKFLNNGSESLLGNSRIKKML